MAGHRQAMRWPSHSVTPDRGFVNTRGQRGSRFESRTFERAILRRLLRALGDPPIRFVLWDGRAVDGTAGSEITVSLSDRRTLWQLLVDPELEFGEAYSDGRIEVEGQLPELLEWVQRAPASGRGRAWLHRRPRRNSLGGSRRNIHHHYDLGNEFYRLWLDDEMLYTCAYFESEEQSLEAAQLAKMEHVCKKLKLRPGEQVIEAGSGWGALAIYMAKHHGVSVRSFNISHQQVEYGQRRVQEEGLRDRVQLIEGDYRSIEGDCDAFVSVGMLEHVGRKNYATIGAVIDRVLRPDGRAFLHTIGRNRPRPLNAWIERRIFPGAYPPTLGEMMEIFEPYDLVVWDVENLRPHYALTLRHWLQRFEAAAETVREEFDERFVRAWRLYLSGSMAAFRSGVLELYQVVAGRAKSRAVPWRRDHLYDRGEVPPWSDAKR